MKNLNLLICGLCMMLMIACASKDESSRSNGDAGTGLKIAFVNGDSILMNYSEFRTASESLEVKQRDAEDLLQVKGAELEKEIMAYQRKAQSGTLSRNEMEVQERRLGAKQEALMNERDQISNALLSETTEINTRLQKIIKEKLEEIKKQEGYDFILSYMPGGPILVADEKYDITTRVLEALNSHKSEESTKSDTSSAR